MRDLIADFFAEKGVPDPSASVGCGPAAVSFDIAERYPETTVVGYDAAASVLSENRERARREDVANVRFERAVLPDFDPDREFDCVFCYGTLCHVSESERALRNLYDVVASDGHLVLGYMNRLAASHHRRALSSTDE